MITDLILLRFNDIAQHIDEYLSKVGNKYYNQVFSDIMDLTEAFYPSIEASWNKTAPPYNQLNMACFGGDYQKP
jgi:formylmethanofuran dehydrogenase subunit E-like metal-binding protein